MAKLIHRNDKITSPEGRRFVVNSITFDGKILLDRLDKQPREYWQVWKNVVDVETRERTHA